MTESAFDHFYPRRGFYGSHQEEYEAFEAERAERIAEREEAHAAERYEESLGEGNQASAGGDSPGVPPSPAPSRSALVFPTQHEREAFRRWARGDDRG